MQDIRKEEKNIRRRIYDALNVMISVELLEKDLSFIRIKNYVQIEKNYSVVNKKDQYLLKLI